MTRTHYRTWVVFEIDCHELKTKIAPSLRAIATEHESDYFGVYYEIISDYEEFTLKNNISFDRDENGEEETYLIEEGYPGNSTVIEHVSSIETERITSALAELNLIYRKILDESHNEHD